MCRMVKAKQGMAGRIGSMEGDGLVDAIGTWATAIV